MANNSLKISKSSEKPVYIDLFAGCGGLSLGLYESGWKGLFAIEKSPLAFETLKHNLIDNKAHFQWPSWLSINCHDIDEVIDEHKDRLIDLRGQVDLVAGGPPCQGFSSAGRRKEDDERNKLIKSYLRFISYVRPKIIFFENVKGFTLEFKKNKLKGLAYSSYVTYVLKRFGYNVTGSLVDFSDYGIPQKRTRFILVGLRNDLVKKNKLDTSIFFDAINNNKEEFIIAKNLTIQTSLKDAISDLLYENGVEDCADRKGFKSGKYTKPKSKYQEYLRRVDTRDNPDSHSFANHRNITITKFKFLIRTGSKNKSVDKKIKQNLGINKHTIIPLAQNRACPTLTTLPDDYIHYKEPRILTVREYARIQSFPDWYEFKGKYKSLSHLANA
ncbi:MAG: DNA cytosine methyltransferase [Cytophagales bacterium]|nr:DNA cytosine methyltransferase [Cytophagales bacterium]